MIYCANHSKITYDTVPASIPMLIVHFVGTFVDHLTEMVVVFEDELHEMEREIEKGCLTSSPLRSI